MTYEQRLIAAGIPPEQAARDAWADELVRLNTREVGTREGYWREQMADSAPTTDTHYRD